MPTSSRRQPAAEVEQPADVDVDIAAVARAAARAAARVPDDQLDQLADLELLEEAARRGVTFTRAVTRAHIIAAAVAATDEPDLAGEEPAAP